MKNLIFILFLFMSNILMSDELSWVDEQIQAIKPPREGMKSRDVSSIQDPFIFLSKNKDKEQETPQIQKQSTATTATVDIKPTIKVHRFLSLSMIMNNSAMINGEWYKVGDSISGYKVAEVKRTSVILNNHNKKLLLSTQSTSNKLKFQK